MISKIFYKNKAAAQSFYNSIGENSSLSTVSSGSRLGSGSKANNHQNDEASIR
jgi:hypothetical protein